ncbi:oxoglutarate/iron-dependent dioxygenase [Artemisia annua]|uniref:procollagen-proline 4-dioxygenase n=1 Tax=Artemisia annua TaxID=35608 RepID=A0A2U1NHH0_ARTAN|nr:oxoglutarate/iron-dependent dioxygenase [Artemisia annua]
MTDKMDGGDGARACGANRGVGLELLFGAIGWGELNLIGLGCSSDGASDGMGKRGDQWTEILSWEPRAFVYHNFLSKEECEYLINLAKPHMAKSTVVDSTTGKSKDSRVRTSSGTFLRRGRDKIIRNIEQRIADFTFIPVEHGEGLQVLHYEEGQKYEPHFDYFLDEFNTKNGGQRIATVLMYLSDVEEGGETVFPDAHGNYSSDPDWNKLSECAKRGIHVKPKMGDALLFWSMRPDATLDPSSLHAYIPINLDLDELNYDQWSKLYNTTAKILVFMGTSLVPQKPRVQPMKNERSETSLSSFESWNDMANLLANIEALLSDKSLVTYIVNRLGNKFAHIASIIRHHFPTFDTTRSMLLVEESIVNRETSSSSF